MKKIIKLLSVFFLLISIFTGSLIFADDVLPQEEFEVDLAYETAIIKDENILLNAEAAIAVESSTGRILYQKNAFDKRAMASTTKIITAIVAIEYGGFDEVVTVSSNAAYTGGSTIKLKQGEKIKLLDLLYGLMLMSGNDAAVAIAEHVAGSEEEYIKLMNAKAAGLSATNTNFVTVHGLDNENHYTTAYDMAIITAYCMKNDMFRKIVSTAETHISERTLRNTNDLLFTYEGTIGVKTGFTNNAGRCLVASAKRDDMEIITVVLGCADKKSRFSDSRKLLDYVFKNYSMKTLIKEGDRVTSIAVIKGKEKEVDLLCTDTIILPINQKESAEYVVNFTVQNEIQAPISENDVIGKLYISYNDENLAVSELEIAEDVDNKSVLNFFMELFNIWKGIL